MVTILILSLFLPPLLFDSARILLALWGCLACKLLVEGLSMAELHLKGTAWTCKTCNANFVV